MMIITILIFLEPFNKNNKSRKGVQYHINKLETTRFSIVLQLIKNDMFVIRLKLIF